MASSVQAAGNRLIQKYENCQLPETGTHSQTPFPRFQISVPETENNSKTL